MTAPGCGPQQQQFFLGQTNGGGKWIQFSGLPDTGYDGNLDQGRVAHAMLGGGTTVQRQAKTYRSYGLSFSGQTPDMADQLVSAAYGLLGNGPYWFVDPLWRNVLPGHIAACGTLQQNSTGFVPSASNTVAFSSSIAPPSAAPLNGVQVWVATASGTLGINQSAALVNEASAVPVIPGVPITFAAWIKSIANTTLTAVANFSNNVGTSVGTVTLSPTWASTSTYARFSATCAPGSFPAGAVTASLRLQSSAATTIHLAAFDDQFVTASVAGVGANALPAWVLGLGVPKVIIIGGQKAAHGGRLWRRNHDITFAEIAA